MEAAKLANPQNLYYPGLETIGDLQFTRREIDVLACILGEQSSKKTASFLSISPKTVENHLHNIMLKLGCNSREDIINFIKKSEKFELIKTHYLSLSRNAFFEQQLKEISTLVRKEKPVYVAIKWHGQNNKAFLLYQLQKHLQLVGIKTIIEPTERHKTTYYQLEDKEPINSTIHCISENLLENSQTNSTPEKIEINYLIQKTMQNSASVIFVLLDKKPSSPISEELNRIGYIDINEQNYYIAVFEILKKILPNSALDKFISIFKSHCEESCISSLNIFNARIKEKAPGNRILRKRLWVFLTACVVLLGVLLSHFLEKETLLREIVGINDVWIQTYEPHLLQATSQAEFYQLRINVLNFGQAKKNAESVEKLFYRLNKALESIRERKDFININFWIWSPFNWPLRKKILSKLEEQEFAMFIALSLNKVSKLMAKEVYPTTIEEINNNIVPKLKAALSKNEHNERRGHLLKRWLAITINIKSIARRRLIETKEKDKGLYRKTLQDICVELSLSLKDYDSSNFNTYIVMHYIKLMLAEEEVDPNEKKKLETEAEYYLTQGAERAPKELAVLSAQGWHYIQKEEYDRALIALNAYLKIDPNNVAVLHNRAQTCLELGEKTQNAEHYQKAYIDATNANEIKPNDCEVIRLLVWSSVYVKGCKEALNKYQKLYKPLCVDGKQDWDDVSAIRGQEAKQLASKISQHCFRVPR